MSITSLAVPPALAETGVPVSQGAFLPSVGASAPDAAEPYGEAAESSFFEFSQLDVSRRLLAEEFNRVRAELGSHSPRAQIPLGIGVLSLSGMGGSGKMARYCAKTMAEAGHRMYLFCATDNFFPKGDIPGVSMLKASVPREPRIPEAGWINTLADELCASVRQEGIDVLHVHYVAGLLEAALLARQRLSTEGLTLKVIATLHGSDVSHFGTDPVHGPAIAKQLAASDAVSAVSRWLANEAHTIFGLDSVPMVIDNAVDIDCFNPGKWSDLRRTLAPGSERILCHTSNFRPVKRSVDTVDILAGLRAFGISARLLLIGAGPDIEKTRDRAAALGILDSVMWPGPMKPKMVADFVAASDIALITSETESFSLAAVEAMACGVPVVGTRCGGIEEVMKGVDDEADGASRLLAGVGDVDAMTRICASLLRDSAYYERVQRRGTFVPLLNFPVSSMVQGYMELIDNVGLYK